MVGDVYMTVTAGSTNASVATEVCSYVTQYGVNLLLNINAVGTDSYFVLPDCFWNTAVLGFSLRNVIITGTSSQSDPLMTFSAASVGIELSNVRLVNPTTSYSNSRYPYTPNWISLFSRYPLLKILRMSQCSLQGALPSSLPSALLYVDLSLNALSGSIPTSIFGVSTISYLNISYNGLTGSIPSNLLSSGDPASFYASMDLSHNSLSGSIPPTLLAPMNSMTSGGLAVLYLGSNQLTGTFPPSLFNLTVPSGTNCAIQLSNNSISGTLSSSMFDVAAKSISYFELDLSANQITGTIPADLFSNLLTNDSSITLLSFAATNNTLTGSIPNFFLYGNAAPVNILFLAFSGNQLTGTVPPFVWNAPSDGYASLGAIGWYLSSNALTGSVSPFTDTYANNLDYAVYLDDNALTGTLPETMVSSSGFNRAFLNVASNRLTGTIPSNFFQFNNATRETLLDVSNNNLSGTISNTLGSSILVGDSTAFRFLAVNCGLNGTLPSTLRAANRAVEIRLDNNQLTGSFPSAQVLIGLPPNLYSNSLPKSLIFTAANNNLTGTLAIPNMNSSGIESYPVTLDLSNNSLTLMTIDATANYVTSLNVSHNLKLAGSIPSSYFFASALVSLDASHTLLNGPFPSVTSTVLNLRTLNLSNTLIAFCNGTNTNRWTTTQMTSCDLSQTSAHSCARYYPSVCDTRSKTSGTSSMVGFKLLATVMGLMALLI